MRKMTKKNKIAAAAASVALVAVGGGAAYAYWSTTGGGSGEAAASAGTQAVTINVSFPQDIAPGGEEVITYTADNPNSSSTEVTLVDPTVTTSNAGCLPAWFAATVPAGPTTVAANASGTALGTGALTFTDEAAVNQDACKGATITVTVDSE